MRRWDRLRHLRAQGQDALVHVRRHLHADLQPKRQFVGEHCCELDCGSSAQLRRARAMQCHAPSRPPYPHPTSRKLTSDRGSVLPLPSDLSAGAGKCAGKRGCQSIRSGRAGLQASIDDATQCTARTSRICGRRAGCCVRAGGRSASVAAASRRPFGRILMQPAPPADLVCSRACTRWR